ncbi:hypothetical protein P9112_002101 [Eukaryota sp. TZLM1-RC]
MNTESYLTPVVRKPPPVPNLNADTVLRTPFQPTVTPPSLSASWLYQSQPLPRPPFLPVTSNEDNDIENPLSLFSTIKLPPPDPRLHHLISSSLDNPELTLSRLPPFSSLSSKQSSPGEFRFVIDRVAIGTHPLLSEEHRIGFELLRAYRHFSSFLIHFTSEGSVNQVDVEQSIDLLNNFSNVLLNVLKLYKSLCKERIRSGFTLTSLVMKPGISINNYPVLENLSQNSETQEILRILNFCFDTLESKSLPVVGYQKSIVDQVLSRKWKGSANKLDRIVGSVEIYSKSKVLFSEKFKISFNQPDTRLDHSQSINFDYPPDPQSLFLTVSFDDITYTSPFPLNSNAYFDLSSVEGFSAELSAACSWIPGPLTDTISFLPSIQSKMIGTATSQVSSIEIPQSETQSQSAEHVDLTLTPSIALRRRLANSKRKLNESSLLKDEDEEQSFVSKFRKSNLALQATLSKMIAYDDLVIGPPRRVDEDQNSAIFDLLKPRRPLKPQPRNNIFKSGVGHGQELSLSIQAVRASNVPVRKSIENNQSSLLTPIDHKSVAPVLQATFRNQTAHTSPSSSSKPAWGETLTLPLGIQSNSNQITSIDADVTLSIFDEVLLPNPHDDRDTHSINLRKEKRFLGTVSIPFQSILIGAQKSARLEGTFSLEFPPFVEGYLPPGTEVDDVDSLNQSKMIGTTPIVTRSNQFSSSLRSFHQNTTVDTDHTFSVTVVLSLNPLPPLKISREPTYLSRVESKELIDRVLNWTNSLGSRFKDRTFLPIVPNLTASAVLICRYLRSDGIDPPQTLTTIPLLLHWVSLIPSVTDAVGFIGRKFVFTTCEEFLAIGGGDSAEHAILFANCLIKLNPNDKIYLVFGGTNLVHLGVFVLQIPANFESIASSKDVIYYDCTRGVSYLGNDVELPLTRVYSLVNCSNFYANVSAHVSPNSISYNISDSNHWSPLFKHQQSKWRSLQGKTLNIPDSIPSIGLRIEERLREKIRILVGKLRGHHPTRFNLSINPSLKHILQRLESSRVQEKAFLTTEYDSLMSKIRKSYHLVGFPLHFNYTDDITILNFIEKSGVFKIYSPNVEFGLAVFVKGYPGSLFSIWVYLVAIEDLRSAFAR